VNNGWARLIVLLLGDPHLLEGRERSQDGATNPHGVLPLGGSNDLDLHGRGSKSGQLLLHTISNTGEHGRTARQDDVAVQILTDVDVALHDRVVGGLVDTSRLHTQERRLEDGLRAPEPLVTDGDDLTVRQFIALLEGRRGSSSLHLLFEVEGNIAELLLDVANDFTLSGGGCAGVDNEREGRKESDGTGVRTNRIKCSPRARVGWRREGVIRRSQ